MNGNGYDDMIYNFIDHLYFHVSFLPTQDTTQVEHHIMKRFPMLGRMSFNHHLQGSPTKSATLPSLDVRNSFDDDGWV